MEQLARAIVDAVNWVKALFGGLWNGEGNIAAQDQEVLWGSISSLAQDVLGFLTELGGKIAAIL